MQRLLLNIVLLLLFLSSVLSLVTRTRNKQSSISFNNTERILFIGGSKVVLGSINEYGYVSIIKNELKLHEKFKNITILNGGYKHAIVETYNDRFDDLILYYNPNIVVLMFGDDDVLNIIKQRKSSYEAIIPFRADLNQLLKKCNNSNLDVILTTPTIIGDLYEGSHEVDTVLEGMSAIVHELGQEYSALAIIELRAAMLYFLERTNHEVTVTSVLTFDGINLNPYGHQFIASHFLRLFGLKDDEMKVLDSSILHAKLNAPIPNIKHPHFKHLFDSDEEEDNASKHIDKMNKFINDLLYNHEELQSFSNQLNENTNTLLEEMIKESDQQDVRFSSINGTASEMMEDLGTANLEAGLFRDVSVDFNEFTTSSSSLSSSLSSPSLQDTNLNGIYDNIDIGLFREFDFDMDNNPTNNDLHIANDIHIIDDNSDVIENIYHYDIPNLDHNDIPIPERNPIDPIEYRQEMFFDFDAFLRENVNINNNDKSTEKEDLNADQEL